MVVHSVTSNQTDFCKDLEAVVRKYASTTFLRPVADHTRTAFERACEFVRSFASQAGCTCGPFSLVLDSGCGTGESTLHLAKRFPNVPVIGIDKSAVRLTKAGNERQLENAADCAVNGEASVPANAFWVRAELLDGRDGIQLRLDLSLLFELVALVAEEARHYEGYQDKADN